MNAIKAKDVENFIKNKIPLRSCSFGDFIVIGYNNSRDVRIKFSLTGSESVVSLGNIRKGDIRDKLAPTVLGMGVVGFTYPSRINGVKLNEYRLWENMLQRCYGCLDKIRFLNYASCTVSDNFKHYTYFYEWANKQIGFSNKGWQLDKDLLVKGNKVYSESVCVFIPQEINNALEKRNNHRGYYAIGVSRHKNGRFFARLGAGAGNFRHLGCFNTEIEAFNVYKTAKENYLKELAEKWKSKIDERAYNALMNYEVSVDD